MKQRVMLSILGKQNYVDQDEDSVELITEGILEETQTGWSIRYQETELTGMAGVTTIFQIEPERITLTRQGPLKSQMVFQVGVFHESLYEMPMGALLVTICATKVAHTLSREGGTVDLTYGIDIEGSATGIVEYHLRVDPMV